MPILYSPSGSPVSVPHGFERDFLRAGYRMEAPHPIIVRNSDGAIIDAPTKDSEPKPKSDSVPPPEEAKTEETPSPSPEPAHSSGKVLINSAPLKELVGLQNVGTAIGRKVIQNRPFKNLEDLNEKVTGVDWVSLSDSLDFSESTESTESQE